MKQILPFTIFTLLVPALLPAQFVELSYGAGYSNQIFYQLEDDASTTVANTDWDIAFTTIGFQDAGIHLNEATSSSGTELELYLAPTSDFDAIISENVLGDRLLNDEISWDYGAFNSVRDPSNFADFGWGTYNPINNSVEGSTVYVLRLRDGNLKKFMIESLVGTTYSFKHADLDGSNEVNLTVDKSNFSNTDLAFFSLASGTVTEAIPSTIDWDLLFTRYSTPLDDGSGNILNYLLTGVLSGQGTEVAQANGVDVTEVAFEDYEAELSGELDVIGYDWKFFDLDNFQWLLPSDRAYFVKTRENRVWKIVFLDFVGSSTGEFTFEKTDLGVVNSVKENKYVADFGVYPNPASDLANFAFTAKTNGDAQLLLRNSLGQIVHQDNLAVQSGFQVQQVSVLGLPAGTYFATLQLGDSQISQPIVIQ